MSKKEPVIHYIPFELLTSKCGLQYPKKFTNHWPDATCKKCNRHNPNKEKITKEEFRKSSFIDLINSNNGNLRNQIAYIGEYWNIHYGKIKKTKTELHLIAGGWSENEEILNWLSQTLFWINYWESSHRGGLYIFKIKE